MIIREIETVLAVMNVASVLIVVPLLAWFISHKLLKIAMNTWIMWEMIIFDPFVILAGDHKVFSRSFHGCVHVETSVTLETLWGRFLFLLFWIELGWI